MDVPENMVHAASAPLLSRIYMHVVVPGSRYHFAPTYYVYKTEALLSHSFHKRKYTTFAYQAPTSHGSSLNIKKVPIVFSLVNSVFALLKLARINYSGPWLPWKKLESLIEHRV